MQSSSSSSTYAQIQGTNYHHKTKKVHGSTSDIISNLPSNVIENILMCLPIRDAVRTCVLSSKWRYNWVKLPQLVFDDMFWKILGENQLSTKKKLLVNMYQVFLLHNGPILKFTLSISGLESCSEIDQFILVVSRNGVQEFTLRIWNGEHHKLPLSFFSCLLLTHLNLRTCVFEPPPTFEGFSRLTSLVFYEVLISADTLASLISSCPLLDQLSLESFAIFDHLEIVARNLTFLHIRANFKTVRFINTPLLAIVSISFKVHKDEQVFMEGETSNMIKFFDSLPVENLHMDYHYVKSLAAGGIPERLPTTLDHLKILKLSNICFGVLNEVACALLLIRSSPNLHKVTIKAFGSTIDVTNPVLEFLNVQGYSDVSLNQLREVEMLSISGMKTELEFIKLLLAKSPMLQNMLIEPDSGKVVDKGLMILKEVIQFRRASPNAEIMYKDPNGD
uniref:F-box domain-containing protein n=1 Tax=Davidia involucrata TaxID=16924 RepID=A0A5B6ZGW5_DAVIN